MQIRLFYLYAHTYLYDAYFNSNFFGQGERNSHDIFAPGNEKFLRNFRVKKSAI